MTESREPPTTDLYQFLSDSQFLDWMPEDVPLRIAKCLKQAGITNFGELMRKTEAELLALPGFNKGLLASLNYALMNVGVHLGMPVQ